MFDTEPLVKFFVFILSLASAQYFHIIIISTWYQSHFLMLDYMENIIFSIYSIIRLILKYSLSMS